MTTSFYTTASDGRRPAESAVIIHYNHIATMLYYFVYCLLYTAILYYILYYPDARINVPCPAPIAPNASAPATSAASANSAARPSPAFRVLVVAPPTCAAPLPNHRRDGLVGSERMVTMRMAVRCTSTSQLSQLTARSSACIPVLSRSITSRCRIPPHRRRTPRRIPRILPW